MDEYVKLEVHVFQNLEEICYSIANYLVKEAEASISKSGIFTFALSGGKSPKFLYNLLAGEYSKKFPWEAVHIFWGDERYVPKDHPDNNYAMANQSFLSKVPLRKENIHPILTELNSPEESAQIYGHELCDFFRNKTEKENNSTFDVILLGIGEDGHTASLFPDSSCLDEKKRWVVSSEAPPSFSQKKRITLTFPVINRSRKAIFLAAGSEKREVVTAILKNQAKTTRLYPAAQVCPKENLLWYVDNQAFLDLPKA